MQKSTATRLLFGRGGLGLGVRQRFGLGGGVQHGQHRRHRSATPTTPTASSANYPGQVADAAPYAEQMYEAWLRDPQSVHVSWRAYFGGLQRGRRTYWMMCWS